MEFDHSVFGSHCWW